MVDLLVTHMDMTEPARVAPPAAPQPGAAVRQVMLGIDAYRDLYRAVGGPVGWDSRLRMDAAELDGLLALPSTHIHILDTGSPAGFCEFNGVGDADVSLSHFGLVPAAQGKGLGSFLLQSALAACWAHRPRRIWLKTDTQDHPNAIRTYERAGFRAYLTRMETFPD